MRLPLITLTSLCLLSSSVLAGQGPQVRPLKSSPQKQIKTQIKTRVQSKACVQMNMA